MLIIMTIIKIKGIVCELLVFEVIAQPGPDLYSHKVSFFPHRYPNPFHLFQSASLLVQKNTRGAYIWMLNKREI